MCSERWAYTLSRRGISTATRGKKKAHAGGDAPGVGLRWCGLEGEFASDLQDARIAGAGDLSECAGGDGGTDRLPVGVVDCVEGFPAKLEHDAFVDFEVAEEPH